MQEFPITNLYKHVRRRLEQIAGLEPLCPHDPHNALADSICDLANTGWLSPTRVIHIIREIEREFDRSGSYPGKVALAALRHRLDQAPI